jgi:hypothetical protein
MLSGKSPALKNGVLCLGLIHGVAFPTFSDEPAFSDLIPRPLLSANRRKGETTAWVKFMMEKCTYCFFF